MAFPKRAMRRVATLAGMFLLGTSMLAGCSTSSSSPPSSDSGGIGSTLKNFVLYGGSTPPPVAASASALEGPECPPVSIADGGATLRTLSSRSADSNAVASQISISDVARECTAAPDGATIVKVGVEGRALLGPGGASARFDTPVRFVIKRGDRIIASSVRRVQTSVSPAEPQGFFSVVEDRMVVPPGTGEFEIEVGLGAGSAPPAGRRARS